MEIHKNPLTNCLYHFVLGYVEREKLESLKINKGRERRCEFYFTFIPLFVPLVLMLLKAFISILFSSIASCFG